jgi:hypothetical protein
MQMSQQEGFAPIYFQKPGAASNVTPWQKERAMCVRKTRKLLIEAECIKPIYCLNFVDYVPGSEERLVQM